MLWYSNFCSDLKQFQFGSSLFESVKFQIAGSTYELLIFKIGIELLCKYIIILYKLQYVWKFMHVQKTNSVQLPDATYESDISI